MGNKEKRQIVITGMHRSGTSLLAQWLYKCGLHLGDDLLGASIGNKEGHYEDMDFLKFHEGLFIKRKLHFSGLIDRLPSNLTSDEMLEFRGLVERKNEKYDLWGWKEPRTCLFINDYREVLPNANYLIVIRDYRTVVSSLITRIYKRTERKYAAKTGLSRFIWDKFKQKRRMGYLQRKWATRFLKTWLLYNQEIKKLIESLPEQKYIVVDQNILLQASSHIFDLMQNNWKLEDLKFIPYAQLFKPNLQSSILELDSFIKNKELIEKANVLQKWLQDYVKN
jgi:hypothetical protein